MNNISEKIGYDFVDGKIDRFYPEIWVEELQRNDFGLTWIIDTWEDVSVDFENKTLRIYPVK